MRVKSKYEQITIPQVGTNHDKLCQYTGTQSDQSDPAERPNISGPHLLPPRP